jgi:hypothetical protein
MAVHTVEGWTTLAHGTEQVRLETKVCTTLNIQDNTFDL